MPIASRFSVQWLRDFWQVWRGPMPMGGVKSAVGIGALLAEGIGDTIRVSLTDDPVEEVKVGITILRSLGLRRRGLDLVACPSCGRAEVDVLGLTIMFPLLPFYAESFGAGPAVVGLLVSTYALCQLVAGPVLGQISDHVGRKPVLTVSQIGTFLGFLVLACFVLGQFGPGGFDLCRREVAPAASLSRGCPVIRQDGRTDTAEKHKNQIDAFHGNRLVSISS